MKYLRHILFVCVIVCSTAFARIDSTETSSSSTPTVTTSEVIVSGGIPVAYLPEEFRRSSMKAWNFGLGYEISYEPGSIGYSSLLVTAEYNLFRFDATGYTNYILGGPDSNTVKSNPNFSASQRPTKIFSLLINYKGTFGASKKSIAPYFLLGVGYMYTSVPSLITPPDTAGGSSKSAISWAFGIGVDIPINDSATLFVQGKSVLGVMEETRQFFPITGGLRYRF